MALGRGLESLIETNPLEDSKQTQLVELDINIVKPNPNQPRKLFNEDSLQELANSIKNYGIIEPIIVKKENNYYQIIAGERRWRAAKKVGLNKIPSVIKYENNNALELSIIENLQREDLNIIELAQGYELLIKEYNYSHEELAEKLGVTRSSVSNILRILKLPDEILEMVRNNEISYGNARALLGIKDQNQQKELAQEIKDKNLSVRSVESLIRKKTKKEKVKNKNSEDQIFIDKLSQWLCENYDAKVKIKVNNQKGKIEFNFNNSDQLKKIVQRLGYHENLI